jgi:hypothetical protein
MALQVKNERRLPASERAAIARRTAAVRRGDWDADVDEAEEASCSPPPRVVR